MANFKINVKKKHIFEFKFLYRLFFQKL